MEAPSMDTVYQAISALYDNPVATEKEKASLWLGDVQKSVSVMKMFYPIFLKRSLSCCVVYYI